METEWDWSDCKYLDIEKQYCDKYKEDLMFYDWFWQCDKCCEQYKSYKEANED